MKTLPGKSKASGLTLIEVLAVLAILAILAALLLPANTHGGKARIPWCMSNQKQIAIALILYQADNFGKYPWQESATNDGLMNLVPNIQMSVCFRALTNYTGKQTQIFVCPSDITRQPPAARAEIANANISYFADLDAITNLNSILTGDRYLEYNGNLVKSGVFIQSTNTILNWANGFHHAQGKPGGVFSFTDGHAQFVRQDYLNRTLQNQPLATNRFCFP